MGRTSPDLGTQKGSKMEPKREPRRSEKREEKRSEVKRGFGSEKRSEGSGVAGSYESAGGVRGDQDRPGLHL